MVLKNKDDEITYNNTNISGKNKMRDNSTGFSFANPINNNSNTNIMSNLVNIFILFIFKPIIYYI